MPKREGDPTWALVITCVLSHLPLFLAFNLLRKRKLTFEMVVCGFSIFVSFMYHLCECLEAIIYLPEIKWHRLDNIGAISSTMGTFINLACLGPETTALVESVGFMLVLILQEGYPWNELFTIGPIVVSGGIPFFMYLLGYRKVKQCLMLKPFFTGIVLTFVGSFFFVLGLDDQNDPFRIFHGLFHVFIALAFFCLWASIKPQRIKESIQKIDPSDTTSVIINA